MYLEDLESNVVDVVGEEELDLLDSAVGLLGAGLLNDVHLVDLPVLEVEVLDQVGLFAAGTDAPCPGVGASGRLGGAV